MNAKQAKETADNMARFENGMRDLEFINLMAAIHESIRKESELGGYYIVIECDNYYNKIFQSLVENGYVVSFSHGKLRISWENA